jgi:hypothetical protein
VPCCQCPILGPGSSSVRWVVPLATEEEWVVKVPVLLPCCPLPPLLPNTHTASIPPHPYIERNALWCHSSGSLHPRIVLDKTRPISHLAPSASPFLHHNQTSVHVRKDLGSHAPFYNYRPFHCAARNISLQVPPLPQQTRCANITSPTFQYNPQLRITLHTFDYETSNLGAILRHSYNVYPSGLSAPTVFTCYNNR